MSKCITGDSALAQKVGVWLGLWLMVSIVLWPHTQMQVLNTWLPGFLCLGFSVAAFWAPKVRYLNIAIAGWLLVTSLALPATEIATTWNNTFVGVGLFAVTSVELVEDAAHLRSAFFAPGSLAARSIVRRNARQP
jgi:hypothetical protein